MLTIKHHFADGGDRVCEAREVTRAADGTLFVDKPNNTTGVTEQIELANGDTLYVMNERGSTIATYHGPWKLPT